MQLKTPAPEVTVTSQRGVFDFKDRIAGNWAVVMFHTAAFTPVCGTEIALIAALGRQKAWHTQFFSVTPDAPERVAAWIADMESAHRIAVTHDVISDDTRALARAFGLPKKASASGPRGYFVFDPASVLAAYTVLPREVGFSSVELDRQLTALALTRHGQMFAPADWTLGRPMIDRTPGPGPGGPASRAQSCKA